MLFKSEAWSEYLEEWRRGRPVATCSLVRLFSRSGGPLTFVTFSGI